MAASMAIAYYDSSAKGGLGSAERILRSFPKVIDAAMGVSVPESVSGTDAHALKIVKKLKDTHHQFVDRFGETLGDKFTARWKYMKGFNPDEMTAVVDSMARDLPRAFDLVSPDVIERFYGFSEERPSPLDMVGCARHLVLCCLIYNGRRIRCLRDVVVGDFLVFQEFAQYIVRSTKVADIKNQRVNVTDTWPDVDIELLKEFLAVAPSSASLLDLAFGPAEDSSAAANWLRTWRGLLFKPTNLPRNRKGDGSFLSAFKIRSEADGT